MTSDSLSSAKKRFGEVNDLVDDWVYVVIAEAIDGVHLVFLGDFQSVDRGVDADDRQWVVRRVDLPVNHLLRRFGRPLRHRCEIFFRRQFPEMNSLERFT